MEGKFNISEYTKIVQQLLLRQAAKTKKENPAKDKYLAGQGGDSPLSPEDEIKYYQKFIDDMAESPTTETCSLFPAKSLSAVLSIWYAPKRDKLILSPEDEIKHCERVLAEQSLHAENRFAALLESTRRNIPGFGTRVLRSWSELTPEQSAEYARAVDRAHRESEEIKAISAGMQARISQLQEPANPAHTEDGKNQIIIDGMNARIQQLERTACTKKATSQLQQQVSSARVVRCR